MVWVNETRDVRSSREVSGVGYTAVDYGIVADAIPASADAITNVSMMS